MSQRIKYGKRLIVDGKRAMHEDCCCGGTNPYACSGICNAGTVPYSFSVTIANVSPCSGMSQNVNGTYTCIPQISCLWWHVISESWMPACIDDFLDPNEYRSPGRLVVGVRFPSWAPETLEIYVTGRVSGFDYDGVSRLYFFGYFFGSANVGLGIDCHNISETINNTKTCSGPYNASYVYMGTGFGGTAVVTS